MIAQNIIAKESAVKLLEKPSLFFQKKRVIEHVEILALPYYLFKAEICIKNGKDQKTRICIDGVSGEYAFVKENLNISDLLETEIEFKIEQEEAEVIANRAVNQFIVTNMRKSIFLQEVKITLLDTFSYPYWVGLYRTGQKGIKFDVIDGLTGQKQGPKMSPVFLKLILQQNESSF